MGAHDVERHRVLSYGYAAIKGTRHEPRALDLDAHGPAGDHRWCLVDVQRRQVLRTVQHPSLVAVRASAGEEITAHLPGIGAVVAAPERTGRRLEMGYWRRAAQVELLDTPLSEAFSEHLGKRVQLAAPDRGDVVYTEPITLITTGTLRELGERTGMDLMAEHARLRSTYLLEHDTPFVEETWRGRTLRLGDALIRVDRPIGRCAVIDLHPETGTRDGTLLQELAAHRPRDHHGSPVLGVCGRVVDPGLGTS